MEPDPPILSPAFERYLAKLPLAQQICLLGHETRLREQIIEHRCMVGEATTEVGRELEELRARVRSISARLDESRQERP